MDRISCVDLTEYSNIDVLYPFRVPIFRYKVEDAELNKQLRAAILDRYEGKPGVGDAEELQNSNRGGGWQSRHELHEWSSSGISRLLRRIEAFAHAVVRSTVEDPMPAHFEDWLVEAWANVNARGARNASHDHYSEPRGTLWSGIYYVDPGDTSGKQSVGGKTVFEDQVGVPREVYRDEDPFAHEFSVEPEPGTMVLFPATLRHRVEPYRGDGLRVTIAWNLYHPGFEIPHYGGTETTYQTLWGSRTLWHVGQILNTVKGVAAGVVYRPAALMRALTDEGRNTECTGSDVTDMDALQNALGDQGRNVSRLDSRTGEDQA